MNKTKLNLFFMLFVFSVIFTSCKDGDFGANPYDPDTPITVSQLPKVTSFTPTEGKTGDVITIKGVNFKTATNVTFGGKSATSFEIVDDSTITAVVSTYGGTGAVAITNIKGTRSLEGFLYIKPIEPGDNPNLALNSIATGTPAIAGAIGNVNDGDISTLWQSERSANEWVQIDLGKVCAINTVITTWDPMAPASEGELQISEDGVNYTTIKTWTGWIMDAWVSGPALVDEGIKKFTFDKVNARYVKLANMYNKSNPAYNMTLKEFEIYNTPPPINLALNCIITATKAISGQASNVNDGALGTWWQAATNNNEWVMVDFGRVQTINNVVLYWDKNACGTDCELLVSQDGETFTSLYNVKEWDAVANDGINNIKFDNVDVRYVKLANIVNNATPWNMTLFEFEIYKQW